MVRTDYEPLASRFDDDRARFQFHRDPIVDELLASNSSVRALDLGCGTGRWLATQDEAFVGKDVVSVGVDPSEAMLAEARAKGVGRVIRGWAEDLPVADATFEYVVCNYTFHHFTDKDRALDEIQRVLTVRGMFRLNNIDPAAADTWWLYEFFPEARAIDAARFWPARRIEQALEAREFSVEVSVESDPTEMSATDALALAERRVASQLALLDNSAYRRGLTRLRAHAAIPKATVTTAVPRLCLTARRPLAPP